MGTEIDRLELRVEAEAHKANAQLDALTVKLNKVALSLDSLDSKQLYQFSSAVTRLSGAVQSISGIKTTDFTRLTKNINKLGTIDSNSLYKGANSIRNLTNSLNSMGNLSDNAAQLAALANGITKLGSVSTTRATTNLPLLATALKNLITTLSTAPVVSSNVISLTNSLANLASQGSKVKTATNGLKTSMNGATDATKKYADANYRAHKYSSTLLSKVTALTAAFFALKNVVTTLWSGINKSMDYGETLNLFQTAYKKIGLEAAENAGLEIGSIAAESYAISFTKEAEGFADYISDKLSLDPNLTKNYQALFAQMTNSMGLVAESSYNMAESFTVLGNDIASLWNIDTKDAMAKLQSGLAGEIEPLRRLGIDISQTSLQLTAKNYGIEDSIEKMSAAAKVQLRWLSIMDQTSVAWGDMAKTLESPSNQLRILTQQWDNLTRSVGNIFLPVLQTVLPYVNGLLIALRGITDSLAVMMGYETPDYTDSSIFTGVVGDLVDIEDEADGATGAIEKLKKATAGFDELTILNPSTSSGAKTDSGFGYGNLDDAINKETTNYLSKFQEELGKVNNQAQEIAEKLQPKLEMVLEVLDDLSPAIAGVAGAFAAYEIIGLFGDLATKISALGTSKVGLIALAIGALIAIGSAVYKAWEEAKKGDLEGRFGSIKLSLEEVEEVAKRITDNGTLDMVATVKTEWEALEEIKGELEENIKTLNKLNWKVSLGLELTEAEEEQYKSAINDYIKNSQAYIDQEQLAVLMSIDLLVSDSETKKKMTESANKFYDASRGELEVLGEKLNKTVTDAWADGLLEIDEAKEVAEIQQQMANVMQQLATSEFEAKMQLLNMNFSGIELTPDSFNKVMEESQKLIDEAVENYDEVTLNLLASVNAQYKAGTIDTEEWEKQIEAVKLGKLSNLGEITLNATKFNLNTLIEGFEVDLDGKAEEFQSTLETFVNNYLTTDDIEYSPDAWNNFFSQIDGAITAGFMEVKGPAGENLEDFVESLKPTKETLESIKEQYEDMGKSVPDSVSKGLTAITYLEAITEDTDAIFSLVATTLNTSEEYTALLEKAKEMGVSIPDWVNTGIEEGKPDLTLGVSGLVNSIDTTITDQTKITESTGKTYGKKAVGSIITGMTSKKVEAVKKIKEVMEAANEGARTKLGISENNSTLYNKYGRYVVDGFNSGIEDKEDTTEGVIAGWANKFIKKFTGMLSINSPSRLFTEFGGYISEGLNNGIEDGMTETEGVLERYANKFKTWGNDLALSDISAKASVNYSVNTAGIKGFNSLVSNGTLTLNTLKSSAESSGAALSEESLYRAFKQALIETPIEAVLSEEKNFKSIRNQAVDFVNRTGRDPFARA